MDNVMKEKGMGAWLQESVCARQVTAELNTDLSLPDYLPEVKRLLCVRAVATPADCYVGVGSTELSGSVEYRMLYAGHDGAIYGASHKEDYRITVPMEVGAEIDVGEGLVCDAEILPEAVTGRVSAPRKLTLRSKLRADLRVLGMKRMEVDGLPAEDETAERLYGEAPTARAFAGKGEAFVLEDEIVFDARREDLRVISAEGEVFVAEAEAGSGCVNCRGEICLKLIYCYEGSEEPYATQLRKLPFSQSIPVDGCEVNCVACAHGVCTDLHTTVEEGRVLCEVTAHLQARAMRSEMLCYVKDVYSTAVESESRYTERSLPQAIRCTNGNFSLNAMLTAEESGLRTGGRVLDAALIPTVSGMESLRGRTILSGRCRCHLLLTDGDEVYAQEAEIPFRYELDGTEGIAEDYDATVSPLSCRVRTDGGRVAVDAELAVCLALRGSSHVRMLEQTRFGETLGRESAIYTVCYPAPADSLWSVAKRYHRTVDSVSELNGLSGSAFADSSASLEGVKFLLV